MQFFFQLRVGQGDPVIRSNKETAKLKTVHVRFIWATAFVQVKQAKRDWNSNRIQVNMNKTPTKTRTRLTTEPRLPWPELRDTGSSKNFT